MYTVIDRSNTEVHTVPHPVSGTVDLTGVTHKGENVLIQFSAAKAEEIGESLLFHARYAREGHEAVFQMFPDLVLSYMWECNNRKNHAKCAYIHEADPAHDSCVFCGKPEERK